MEGKKNPPNKQEGTCFLSQSVFAHENDKTQGRCYGSLLVLCLGLFFSALRLQCEQPALSACILVSQQESCAHSTKEKQVSIVLYSLYIVDWFFSSSTQLMQQSEFFYPKNVLNFLKGIILLKHWCVQTMAYK